MKELKAELDPIHGTGDESGAPLVLISRRAGPHCLLNEQERIAENQQAAALSGMGVTINVHEDFMLHAHGTVLRTMSCSRIL